MSVLALLDPAVHLAHDAVSALAQLLPTALWSVAIWMIIVLSVWTGFRAASLELPMTAALCVIAFIGLGVSLPSSPGFIGVIQAATVLALSFFGVGKADALGFSLMLHASQFVPVTVWGLLLLVVEHVSLAEASRGAGLSVNVRQD